MSISQKPFKIVAVDVRFRRELSSRKEAKFSKRVEWKASTRKTKRDLLDDLLDFSSNIVDKQKFGVVWIVPMLIVVL